MRWLRLSQVSELAHVTERALQLLIKRSPLHTEISWRGSNLVVRQVQGVGGNSGKAFEVQASSLPRPLQLALKAKQTQLPIPFAHGPKAQNIRAFRRMVISPALAHPPKSTERRNAIVTQTERDWITPNGKTKRYSERTIARWVEKVQFDVDLGNKRRSDFGRTSIIVTRQVDKAAQMAGLPDTLLHEIADKLKTKIRSLIVQGASRKLTRKISETYLYDLTREVGLFNDGLVFVLPEHLIQNQRDYRKVERFERDRKAHHDALPRITRTIDGMQPMDIVMADVHPVDILYTRDDGSIATPRLIGWHCVATGRFFGTVFFCDAGKDITNAHVIESLLSLIREWGVPKTLYLDNGSEYNWADAIEPGLRLLSEQISHQGHDGFGVTRSKPYAPQTKTIEGIFGVLENTYLRHLPGWIAGDRMRKKTANVGKAPVPFPGNKESLEQVLKSSIALYNTMPQRGQLRNKSPNETYQAAINAGWTMTAANLDAFQMAFSEETIRTVHQGCIQWNGDKWTCPELQSYLGDKVMVLVPKYQHWQRLPIKSQDGRALIGFAEREVSFGYLDPEGAKESARRAACYEQSIKDLKRTTAPVDVQQELTNVVKLLAPPRAPVGAVLGMSDEAQNLHASIHETKAEKRQREDEAATRKQDEALRRITEIQKRGNQQ
jgi:hypothetical protein